MSQEDKLEELLVVFFRDHSAPTTKEVGEIANFLARKVGVESPSKERVIKTVVNRFSNTMSEGVSLTDKHSAHDPKWCEDQSINWKYWNDYKKMLSGSEMGLKVVDTMSKVTLSILGQLQNPILGSVWDRRGLVIGHVQSGKTANYTGLICRAADAGYKFIIVIAGIQNSLRDQTQERIDEWFVGRDSSHLEKRKIIGVGKNRDGESPISLTTANSDFSLSVANQLNSELSGYKYPVIVVIKKNVTTLQNLYKWLEELNTGSEARKISDIPMLMIDDEADHASINTNEDDPTKTNACIRSILNLFTKKSFIGYTATPFANIFINPESNEKMLEDDLFPRDFIYCLNAPTNYFGPDKVFLDSESENSQLIRTIDDAEVCLPLSHKKEFVVKTLPRSLQQSINTFILAQAIKKARDGKTHCSMLINASKFVLVQRQIAKHVSAHVESVKSSINKFYKLSDEEMMRDMLMHDLRNCYKFEFDDVCTVGWPNILKTVVETIGDIKILTINNEGDKLNYKYHEDKGKRLTAIAVGGFSLSRGLTLEGLLVSYMYRNTKTYDTLMQMARWFGYREDYEDLCKIWMSRESEGWYSYIAEVIRELCDQINDMQQQNCTPKEFALSVRTHPDNLRITAPDKMRNTDRVTVSFNGKLVESHIVSVEEEVIGNNSKGIIKLINELQQRHQVKVDQSRGLFWEGVSWESVNNFLHDFKFHNHKDVINRLVAAREYLKKISIKHPKVDVAFITPKAAKAGLDDILEMRNWESLCQERTVGVVENLIDVAEMDRGKCESGYLVSSRQRVGSRGCESVGLTDMQKREAAEANKEKERKNNTRRNISDAEYRKIRNKPLLMIHILRLKDGREGQNKNKPLVGFVPAIGMSFPYDDYLALDQVVVNKGIVENIEEREWEE